jgi:purine-nucleoside phosphorylase
LRHLAQQIDEAVTAIRARSRVAPRVGIILGTGLGGLADQIEHATAIPYDDLPHFPRSTAIGHRGRLILGELAGVPVAAMQGRFHLYEGYSSQQVTLPVRVFNALGVGALFVTNAAGGLSPYHACGDLVVLDDHIDLMAGNPLIGVNDDGLGPRFPDMSRPYDPEFIEVAERIARREDFVLHRGVYVGMTGPTYETRAEYRFVRRIGGDVVGMSTVPEVIVAAHAGLRVLGLSTVTNVGLPDALGETSGEDVVQAAAIAGKRLIRIFLGVLETCF